MNRIYLIGFMGCGKSRLAPALAEVLNFPVVDTDEFIEQEQGVSITQLFAQQGEARFRALEREALRNITSQYDQVVVATGGGLPCFYDNMDYMNQQGLTIYINPPEEVLLSRLKASTHRPLLQGKNEDELQTYLKEKLNEREPFYTQAQWTIHSPILSKPSPFELGLLPNSLG